MAGSISGSLVQTQRRQRAEPGTNQHRQCPRQVDDRGRLDAAMATVEDQFKLAVESITYLPAFSQPIFVTGEDQRRGQQRLAKGLEQRQRDRVRRNAQADGLAFRVKDPPVRSRMKVYLIGVIALSKR